MGYIDIDYQGSYAENSVKYETLEELMNRRRYAEMAVDFHREEGNQLPLKFFSDQLKHINKRIKHLEKRALRLLPIE